MIFERYLCDMLQDTYKNFLETPQGRQAKCKMDEAYKRFPESEVKGSAAAAWGEQMLGFYGEYESFLYLQGYRDCFAFLKMLDMLA